MSSFASNLALLARSKLDSSYRSGTKDKLSLHRWVLLKNVISKDSYSTSGSPCTPPVADTPDHEASTDYEEEEVDSDMDEGSMFAFLFPDPGDASVTSREDALLSEAQWLDSLLQSLEEDDDDDSGSRTRDRNLDVNCMVVIESSDDHLGASSVIDAPQLSEDKLVSLASSAAVSYSVPYSPLAHTFDLSSSTDSSNSGRLDTYHHAMDDSEGPVPDAIEDTSDDESDTLSTPFSRSHASLSFADPASISSSGDRHESILYPDLDKLYPFECDSLPYVYCS